MNKNKIYMVNNFTSKRKSKKIRVYPSSTIGSKDSQFQVLTVTLNLLITKYYRGDLSTVAVS